MVEKPASLILPFLEAIKERINGALGALGIHPANAGQDTLAKCWF